MLFYIDESSHEYQENFDEFPDKESHDFRFSVCACGAGGGQLVSTTTRHRNFMTIFACESCGTLRASPYFTPETAKHYYENVYGPIKRKGQEPEAHHAHQRANSLLPFLKPDLQKFKTVLDFGGGSGGRTVDLLNEGKEVSLLEVEGDYSAKAFSSGLSSHAEGTRYDLVIVSHVIEHLLDPHAEMQSIIDTYCNEGGFLLVATPIIDYVKARKWLRMFHYAHKYYFTRDSLVGLMASIGGQLVRHDEVDNFMFSLGEKASQEAVFAFNESGRLSTEKAIAEATRFKTARRLLGRR